MSMTESRTVELGGAESVRANIEMGAGILEVAGGVSALLEAEFAYDVEEWKPTVDYGVTGTEGTLLVKFQQPIIPKLRQIFEGEISARYRWNLRLNDDVPIDLKVLLGAGSADLKLGSLTLTGLDLQTGAGDVTVDLSGDWTRDLDASIKGGVGRMTIKLPREIGVRVQVRRALVEVSTYGLKRDGSLLINEAYNKSEATLRLDVDAAVGQINLEVVD